MLRCGHYSTGKTPFKFVDGWILTRFLKRALVAGGLKRESRDSGARKRTQRRASLSAVLLAEQPIEQRAAAQRLGGRRLGRAAGPRAAARREAASVRSR